VLRIPLRTQAQGIHPACPLEASPLAPGPSRGLGVLPSSLRADLVRCGARRHPRGWL